MLGSTAMGKVTAPPVVSQGFPPPGSVVAQGLPSEEVTIAAVLSVGSVEVTIDAVLSENVVRDSGRVTISEVLCENVVIGPADDVGDSVGITI